MQGKKIVYFPILSIFNCDLQRKSIDLYREYDFTKNRKGREVSGANQIKFLLSSVNSVMVGKNKRNQSSKSIFSSTKVYFTGVKNSIKE